LSRYFGLAAVSSSAALRLDACLRATGLASLISPTARFSAEDSLPVPTSKPDPAVYLFAAEALGLRKDHGLAIEDAVPGVQSAVAAGFVTVGNVMFVPAGERGDRSLELREAGASAVIGSWRELCEVLIPPAVRPSAGTATPVRMPLTRPMNRSIRDSPVRPSFRRPPEKQDIQYRKGAWYGP
jgi:beta-phosphoglucomutase-like phosphatase (HAD superfamily)